MGTVEIPRPDWTRFFRYFIELHEGWRCRIEVLGESLGAQSQITGMPLVAIDTDLHAEPHIKVALEEDARAHLTHVIDSPEHVWLLDVDGDEIVEIEGTELRTLLRFERNE